MSDYPPGTIGVLSLELLRYATFGFSMAVLQYPEGSKVVWPIGKQICVAMNAMVEQVEGEWLWIMGDDHVFAPESLLHLLSRDVDIVAPLNVQREPNFEPHVYRDRQGRVSWQELSGKTGLVEVDACGTAGMLIRRHVLDALPKPLFRPTPTDLYASSDLTFCQLAREHGYKIYVDLDLVMGHTAPATFVPMRDEDGSWGVGVRVKEKLCMMMRM